MNWIKKNEAVYATDSAIVKVTAADVALLKENVSHTPQNRIRLCAHQSSSDSLHEMIILLGKGSYIRPHKHLNKCESFHLIEGELDVVVFDDAGQIIEIIEMGESRSGKCFFYRLAAPYFHTLFLRSDQVIFHETTNGPFNKEQTVYAPWSPLDNAEEEAALFLSRLEQDILLYQQGRSK